LICGPATVSGIGDVSGAGAVPSSVGGRKKQTGRKQADDEDLHEIVQKQWELLEAKLKARQEALEPVAPRPPEEPEETAVVTPAPVAPIVPVAATAVVAKAAPVVSRPIGYMTDEEIIDLVMILEAVD
jgi:hypothetical protein